MSTIWEWVQLFLTTGDVVAQEANAGGGADEAFDVAELAYLKQIVDSNPTMMLDKLVYHMYYHTGKYVEISTMRRVLHRGGYVNLQIKERMLRGPAFMAGAVVRKLPSLLSSKSIMRKRWCFLMRPQQSSARLRGVEGTERRARNSIPTFLFRCAAANLDGLLPPR